VLNRNISINNLLLLVSVLLAQMFLTFWMFHVLSVPLLTCMRLERGGECRCSVAGSRQVG
jgi:hypothetical protein